MKLNKLYAGLGALLVVVAVVVGIMVSKPSSTRMNASTSQPAVMTNAISIQNYMFSPMVVKVKVGTAVTWTNHDAVNHTITADDTSSSAPNSMDIAQGKSYTFTFNKVGTYTYHCFPHPYMHGTVEVTN